MLHYWISLSRKRSCRCGLAICWRIGSWRWSCVWPTIDYNVITCFLRTIKNKLRYSPLHVRSCSGELQCHKGICSLSYRPIFSSLYTSQPRPVNGGHHCEYAWIIREESSPETAGSVPRRGRYSRWLVLPTALLKTINFIYFLILVKRTQHWFVGTDLGQIFIIADIQNFYQWFSNEAPKVLMPRCIIVDAELWWVRRTIDFITVYRNRLLLADSMV